MEWFTNFAVYNRTTCILSVKKKIALRAHTDLENMFMRLRIKAETENAEDRAETNFKVKTVARPRQYLLDRVKLRQRGSRERRGCNEHYQTSAWRYATSQVDSLWQLYIATILTRSDLAKLHSSSGPSLIVAILIAALNLDNLVSMSANVVHYLQALGSCTAFKAFRNFCQTSAQV